MSVCESDMSNQRGGKSLIITDGECRGGGGVCSHRVSLRHSSSCSVCADEEVEEEVEELNPFSFREFLRWKNQDPEQEQEQDPEQEQARTEVRAAQLHMHLCPVRQQHKHSVGLCSQLSHACTCAYLKE